MVFRENAYRGAPAPSASTEPMVSIEVPERVLHAFLRERANAKYLQDRRDMAEKISNEATAKLNKLRSKPRDERGKSHMEDLADAYLASVQRSEAFADADTAASDAHKRANDAEREFDAAVDRAVDAYVMPPQEIR